MPESVCEELLDELFDNPFLTFADYLSLLRRKRIARGFDYDDLLKPFTFSDQLFESQQRDIVEKFGHVNMLKPPEQAHQYEYVSRAAALRSRQRLFDVSLEDAVLMRIYGEANKDRRERPERKTSLARLIFLKDFINLCWRRGD